MFLLWNKLRKKKPIHYRFVLKFSYVLFYSKKKKSDIGGNKISNCMSFLINAETHSIPSTFYSWGIFVVVVSTHIYWLDFNSNALYHPLNKFFKYTFRLWSYFRCKKKIKMKFNELSSTIYKHTSYTVKIYIHIR